jgi:HlyD family secretion protein
MSISIEQDPSSGSWVTARNIRLGFGAVLALVAMVLAYRLITWFINRNAPPEAPAIPLVTVASVGVSAAPTLVSITGTISARYDIPIGVEGDGGRVAKVFVEAGDKVKRGQVLARLDTSVVAPQVASLGAALEQARAEAELAQAEYRRAESVSASGALSTEEIQRRKSSSVTAQAKVKLAAAQLAEAQARLGRTDVRAPADGVVLTRTVEVGQMAIPGGPALFRLSEGGEVELRGQVAEQDLPLLQVGQKATVRLTGLDRPYEGEIRLLGAVIDPQTRLGSVRVALKSDPNLRPGAFARADVTVSRKERAILPQSAVLTDANGPYVMVVDSSNKVRRRAVRLAGTSSDGVLIASGLDAKDRVVTTAGSFLQEGEPVNVTVGKSNDR